MSPTFTVAYLCEYPTLLGGERSLLAFLEHRAAAAMTPIVVAVPGGLLVQALEREGIVWVPWPSEGRQAAADLVGALRARQVDLVHANSLLTAEAAAELGRALGIPAVAHVRDIMKLSSKRRERLSKLAALMAVSDAVSDWLRSQGLPPERITRIYNAVDPEKLLRTARARGLRQELGLDEDAILIGCIGQIALRKGQDVFLAAAARIALAFPRAQFLIVGERYSVKLESRTFEARLHRSSETSPLAGRTHWLGFRDDIPTILANLDVLVVPSRQEPLSRILMEGLAVGVPAVATQVGGTAEILADGEVGLLVPSDDPEAMAEAIGRLLEDQVLRESLCAVGLRRMRELFSPKRQVEAIRAVYEKVLAARGTKGSGGCDRPFIPHHSPPDPSPLA